MMNELSGTKQASLNRTGITALFHRGVLLLNSLLSSIDENLLR